MTENKKGGAGLGQGRKLKFKEPTRQLNIRVPESKHGYIKSILNRWIEKFK